MVLILIINGMGYKYKKNLLLAVLCDVYSEISFAVVGFYQKDVIIQTSHVSI
jgi:hypothetical protein